MSKILLIKNFNHETENKATPVGLTALILMFFAKGRKYQKSSTFIACIFQANIVSKLSYDNKYFNESI